MSTTVAAALAADAMVRAPKVHEAALTVGDCHAALADDHVHMLLLVEEGRLLGTLVRGDVPTHAAPATAALPYASSRGRTVGPDEPVEALRTAMLASGVRRLAVVDDRGSLLGLLCLKRHLGGFCSDADVAARAADRSGCR
jgi:CBS-domain-containing membrane protein